MAKYYYGAYQRGHYYIIITPAFSTHDDAWSEFKKRDEHLRRKHRMWHLDNLWGHWHGVLAINERIDVDVYPHQMVEILAERD
jgi:hypothetical protein